MLHTHAYVCMYVIYVCAMFTQVDKKTYLREFDAMKNGPLLEQEWVHDIIKGFRNANHST